MKKVVILGPRKAGLAEAPDPQAKGDWAVVKVHAVPMCTEYKAFVEGKHPGLLGHEAAGEVVAVDTPGKVKVGDRVVAMPLHGCGKCALCLGGDFIYCEDKEPFKKIHGTTEGEQNYAQYILKQSWLLMPIPDGVSYEKAGLACCALGPSFGSFEAMNVGAFDTVLITGVGPVGLGAVVNASFRGARIIVVESIPYRVKKAKALGADVVLDPADPKIKEKIMDLTGGRGADCALDCSGVVQAQRLCIDATRRRGKIAFVGECFKNLGIKVSPDMIRKGLTIMGIWHYNLNVFPKVMKVIQESPVIDELISHVMPMSKIQKAFEVSASNQTAKMMLKPWE